MTRRKQQEPELPDLCGRQAGRFPQQWQDIPAEELRQAHERARCLRASGHGSVQWGRPKEEDKSIKDDGFSDGPSQQRQRRPVPGPLERDKNHLQVFSGQGRCKVLVELDLKRSARFAWVG